MIICLQIRAKRSSPGLKAQHLTGLQLVEQFYDGRLKNGKVGAMDVTMVTGAQWAAKKEFEADIGTAG